MPNTITRLTNYSSLLPSTIAASVQALISRNLRTQHNQQLVFNRAMNLYHHPQATLEHRRLARRALRKLVRNYNRTWTQPVPPAARFRAINYNSGPNSRGGSPSSSSNNGTNYIALAHQMLNAAHTPAPRSAPSAATYAALGQSWLSAAPALGPGGLPSAAHYLAIGGHSAAAAPNYSKASAAVKKWLSSRPHTIHQTAVHIKLPANARDPVSYNNFAPGNEAVMVIKKRLQANGAMRSKRTFYTKNSIGTMTAKYRRIPDWETNPVPWRKILRMKGSDVVFKDPLNRRSVYRRDIMNVKFVAPRR